MSIAKAGRRGIIFARRATYVGMAVDVTLLAVLFWDLEKMQRVDRRFGINLPTRGDVIGQRSWVATKLRRSFLGARLEEERRKYILGKFRNKESVNLRMLK